MTVSPTASRQPAARGRSRRQLSSGRPSNLDHLGAVMAAGRRRDDGGRAGGLQVGLYPIVTSQYSSPTSYQVSYHIQ